jgi:hypothetical protein
MVSSLFLLGIKSAMMEVLKTHSSIHIEGEDHERV